MPCIFSFLVPKRNLGTRIQIYMKLESRNQDFFYTAPNQETLYIELKHAEYKISDIY